MNIIWNNKDAFIVFAIRPGILLYVHRFVFSTRYQLNIYQPYQRDLGKHFDYELLSTHFYMRTSSFISCREMHIFNIY